MVSMIVTKTITTPPASGCSFNDEGSNDARVNNIGNEYDDCSCRTGATTVQASNVKYQRSPGNIMDNNINRDAPDEAFRRELHSWVTDLNLNNQDIADLFIILISYVSAHGVDARFDPDGAGLLSDYVSSRFLSQGHFAPPGEDVLSPMNLIGDHLHLLGLIDEVRHTVLVDQSEAQDYNTLSSLSSNAGSRDTPDDTRAFSVGEVSQASITGLYHPSRVGGNAQDVGAGSLQQFNHGNLETMDVETLQQQLPRQAAQEASAPAPPTGQWQQAHALVPTQPAFAAAATTAAAAATTTTTIPHQQQYPHFGGDAPPAGPPPQRHEQQGRRNVGNAAVGAGVTSQMANMNVGGNNGGNGENDDVGLPFNMEGGDQNPQQDD